MKFVADGMLGKLTRWLRLLGHDVKYSNKTNDAQIIATARKEKRTLLTRDLELYKQAAAKNIDAFYLEGQTGEQKLAELAERFNIDLNIDMATSRCPKCNTRLKPILKEKVMNSVKKNTYANYDEFWRCPKCGQIYWQGAHWAGIRKTLETTRRYVRVKNSQRPLLPF